MKIIGFLLRLVLAVALVVWLADRPGTAQIVWRDYQIDTSAAVLGVMVLAFAYVALLLHRLWRFLWDGPRFWRLKRRISKMVEGEAELAKGLAAVAAGQAVEAGRHAVKARQMLGETPIAQLIQAQAAQLAGDEGAAHSLFEAMTLKADTAVLGYRGLIMSALRRGDFDEASRAAIRLEQTKVDVPWLQLIRFEMGARKQNWALASEALGRARKAKALPAPKADRHEAALLAARAKAALKDDLGREALVFAEKAHKLAPSWLPASLLLAEALIASKHGRAAHRTIERAWAREPHPQLLALVQRMAGTAKPLDALRLVEKVTKETLSSPYALFALAEAALRAHLWGEARRYAMALVGQGNASQKVYKLLAQLERCDTGNELAASAWLAKGMAAPVDAQWVCSACGAAQEVWEATCPACGAFDRMGWDVPGQSRSEARSSMQAEMLAYFG